MEFKLSREASYQNWLDQVYEKISIRLQEIDSTEENLNKLASEFGVTRTFVDSVVEEELTWAHFTLNLAARGWSNGS